MTMAAAPLSYRLTAAFDMARRVHDTKTIKGTDLPYLLHLLDVCSIALRHGAEEDQAIAALLHDVVEDGGGAPMAEEIRAEFGDRVTGIVLACSDSVVQDAANKRPWWDRKVAYIDHLAVASEDVALVSAADKLSNARAILADFASQGDSLWGRFNTGRAGTLWYYRAIAGILPGRLPRTEGGERIGKAFTAAVTDLIDAVGHTTAANDWRLALVEVDKLRAVNASVPGIG